MAKMMQATGWWRQNDDCLDKTKGSIRMHEKKDWESEAVFEISEEEVLDDLYYGTGWQPNESLDNY